MLLAAFAFSLLVHAFLAIFFHPPRPTAAVSQTHELVRLPPVAVQTRPPQMPQPRRTPHRILVPHVQPALHATHAPYAQPSPPAPAPSAAVAASPSPPSPGRCTNPDAPAGVLAAASPPPIPAAVRAQDVTGMAAVLVHLDPNGTVTTATIEQSTNSPSFDAIAMEMARETQYAPARHACAAVASTYLFRVQFSAW